MGRARRYGVLLCAEESDYIRATYEGYLGVYKGLLEEKDETWDVYNVVKGEFPKANEMECHDGFVITGSCSDAHGNDPWICQLLIFLKKLLPLKIKILGICFGHQILSRALGGRTGRSHSWDIGLRTVHFTSSPKLLNLDLPTSLDIIECHRDEVKELPPEAEVIAWSDQTGIEMFKYGDHIMGIQGHPEYSQDILLHLIDRLLGRNLIMESYACKLRAMHVEREPDREAWRRLCISFLKA